MGFDIRLLFFVLNAFWHLLILHRLHIHFATFLWKEIKFVPLYITPRLKKMVLGEPVSFDSQAEIEGERKRIRAELMKKITFLGEKLPCHTVIPYRNIRKKDYPKNRGE